MASNNQGTQGGKSNRGFASTLRVYDYPFSGKARAPLPFAFVR